MSEQAKKKRKGLGLIPKLLIGIALGIVFGKFFPEGFNRVVFTISGVISQLINFIIPMMILAYVTMGIANLSEGAGKLLLITVILAYGSTIIAGSASYAVSSNLFPNFITAEAIEKIHNAEGAGLESYITMDIPPLFDTISAVVLAFILGLALSNMRGRHELGDTLYNFMNDFSKIIDRVLNVVVIPLIPILICGTFTNMTYSGTTFTILGILWKVFLVVLIMHWVYLIIQFLVAGGVSKKNPFRMLKNQLPGYATALGTQSSAATIPVNLQCAETNGMSKEIRNFAIPLCANIHMCGSMITIVACATAVCYMYSIPISMSTVVPFVATLGVAMVASPGAPGGSIMTALPFLYLIFGKEAGAVDGALAQLMIALYITQDSFGTACNVSGDDAIGTIVDTIYRKHIRSESTAEADA